MHHRIGDPLIARFERDLASLRERVRRAAPPPPAPPPVEDDEMLLMLEELEVASEELRQQVVLPRASSGSHGSTPA